MSHAGGFRDHASQPLPSKPAPPLREVKAQKVRGLSETQLSQVVDDHTLSASPVPRATSLSP